MRRYIWPLVILVSAFIAVLIASSSYDAPIRGLFSLWFLLVCPGMAFIRLFKFTEKLAEWVLAIGLSIAIDVIVSEIAVLNQRWSLQGMVDVLVIFSVTGALAQAWIVHQKRKQGSNELDVN